MWIIELAAGAWLGKTIIEMCFDTLQAHYDYKHAAQRSEESRAKLAALQASR
jgi:hypothetical protein